MSECVIYHNPKCSKSREALQILTANGIDPEIIEYLEEPISKKQLKDLFKALRLKPKNCLRTKEEEFKKLKIDLEDDDLVIDAIIKTPKILERPIVQIDKKAIIARPPELVMELL